MDEKGIPDLPPIHLLAIYATLALAMFAGVTLGQSIGGVGSTVAVLLPVATTLAAALAHRQWLRTGRYPQIARTEATKRWLRTWRLPLHIAVVASIGGMWAASMFHKVSPAMLIVFLFLSGIVWAIVASVIALFQRTTRG